ncbi:class I SAM-dependent methyltransferase [Endothiovibrio diazotrophicus]
MRKSLATIYDRFADTYEENRGLFDMTEVFEDFFARLDAENGRVLDLGCGAGEPFASAFIARGWSATGVDFSPHMLEMARKYVPQMEAILSDMRDAEFPPARFDAVTVIYALFHLPRDDHFALFEKMFRWLRPGGSALFTYATEAYTGQPEFDGYKAFMGQELYYSHKRPEALREELERAGFAIEATDYRGIGGEVFLWVTARKPE